MLTDNQLSEPFNVSGFINGMGFLWAWGTKVSNSITVTSGQIILTADESPVGGAQAVPMDNFAGHLTWAMRIFNLPHENTSYKLVVSYTGGSESSRKSKAFQIVGQ
jgi:hypothetical protein